MESLAVCSSPYLSELERDGILQLSLDYLYPWYSIPRVEILCYKWW